MSDLTSAPAESGANPRRWRILWMVGIAQLMLILDVTVVAIALPHVGTDLGLARETLTWVVSGYTLAFGGLLLLGGRAADLFGARRLVLIGLALFAAASLVAGLAVSGPMLLAGSSTARSATRPSASGPRSAAAAPLSACCSAACSPPDPAGPGSSSSTFRSAWS